MSGLSSYHKRRAAGLCGYCGKEPALPGLCYGAICQKQKIEKDAVRYAAQKENRKKGLCSCGAVPDAGRKMCRFCRTKQMEATRRYLERKKEANT